MRKLQNAFEESQSQMISFVGELKDKVERYLRKDVGMMDVYQKMIQETADILSESLLRCLFQHIKMGYEEKIEKLVIQNKANEGIKKESIGEAVIALTNALSNQMYSDGIGYTKEELRKKFDTLYSEYFESEIEKASGTYREEDIKEEIWKRFLIFSQTYLLKYEKTLTYGDRCILGLVRDMQKSNNELIKMLPNKAYMDQLAERQSQLLGQLCENIDIPFMDIVKLAGVGIENYNSKFCFYENVFDFDQNEDRADEEETKTHIFSMLVRNIGSTNIEEIKIQNLHMQYCKECADDNPESGYYVLKIVQHDEPRNCKINILPNGEQRLYFIFTDKMDELEEAENRSTFLEDEVFKYDRIFISFDAMLKGKKEVKEYQYFAYLSKINTNDDSTMNGGYSIDYSGFNVMDS